MEKWKNKNRFDSRKNCQIIFYLGKCWEKSFFAWIGRNRKSKMNTVDFINIRGQQKFLKNSINPIEIKIENNTIKNMIDKYKKHLAKFTLEGLLFSSSIQNETETFFLKTTGLLNAKYSWLNWKIYQSISIINLNENYNWEKILKTSRWVNVSFQPPLGNRQMQHFANNFITISGVDILDFGIKLIDDNNKEIESADGEKKIPHRKLFDWIFSIHRINRKKKIREEHLEDVPAELEKYLSNFQITIQKKIRQYKNTLGF